MAHALSDAAKEFSLHYWARSRRRAAFWEWISGSAFGHRTNFHFDDDATAPRFSLRQALESRAANVHVYICGPAGFINVMKAEAASVGVLPAHVHIEHFNGAAPVNGAHFTVVAKRSGVIAEVGESQTIAQVLAAHGVAIALSCEQGVCGTCLTPVLDGLPDHRDMYQSDDEKGRNDQVAICCSRARSPRLVLDI